SRVAKSRWYQSLARMRRQSRESLSARSWVAAWQARWARRSGGTGHSGRVASPVPNGVNDDFGLWGFVENQIWVRRRGHPTYRRIVRAAADMRMQQQQVGQALNTGLDAPRALRRMGGHVIKDRAEVGEGRTGVPKLHRPCLAHTARTS